MAREAVSGVGLLLVASLIAGCSSHAGVPVGTGGTGGGAATGGNGGSSGAGTGGNNGGSGGRATGGNSGRGGAGTGGNGGSGAVPCNLTIGWGTGFGAVFSPAGSVVALYSIGNAPELHRWPSDTLLPLAENDVGASAVAFSPDGALFAASTFKSLNVWRVSDGTLVRQIPEFAGARAINLSTAGDVILVEQTGALVWRLSDPTNIRKLAVPAGLDGAALTPDGSRAATMASGMVGMNPRWYLTAWTTVDGTQIWENTQVPALSGEGKLVFSPDGTMLASWALTFGSALVDAATGTTIRKLTTLKPSAFSADGQLLAGVQTPPGTGSASWTPALQRVSDGTIISPLTPPNAGTSVAVGFGAGPGYVPLVVEQSGTAFTYFDNGVLVGSREVHTFGLGGIAMSASGQLIATSQYTVADQSQPIPALTPPTLLWDASTGLPSKSWPAPGVGPFAFLPDASVLFSLAGTHLRALPLAAGAPSYDLDTGMTRWPRLVVSPSGKLLGIPGPQYTAQLRRAADGTLLSTLWDVKGHSDNVVAVAFSPDEKTIATGSWDKRIRLWDTATGAGGAFLTGAAEAIEALAFTTDGSGIISGEVNGDVRLWNIGSATTTAMANVRGRVTDLAVSPDGTVIFVPVSSNGTYTVATGEIHRFHLPDLTPLSPVPPVHATPVTWIALSGDGSRLASVGEDGVFRMQCLE